MNGVVFHTSTMTTAHSAVSGLAVQAMGAEISPSRRSMSLIDAELVVQHPVPHLAETTVGMAQGTRTMARMMPRPGKPALRTSATMMAENGLGRDRDEREPHRVPDRLPPIRDR